MSDVDALARHAAVPLELASLVVSAAADADVPLVRLRGPEQTRQMVKIRDRIALAARRAELAPRKWHPNGGPFSLWEIGRALNRDHSTIRSALRRAGAGQ